MVLFVDKLQKYDLGGFTTDIKKAEYILAVNNLTFEKVLSEHSKTTKIPSGMFASGKYVVAFNISWDLKNVNISFKLNEVGSAYLMVIGGYGTTGTSNNYILNLNSSETSINLSNYSTGFYTVALVCNGQIVDAKTLIKQ